MAYHAYLQRNHQIWLINNTVPGMSIDFEVAGEN
jgi:hypothetical protein